MRAVLVIFSLVISSAAAAADGATEEMALPNTLLEAAERGESEAMKQSAKAEPETEPEILPRGKNTEDLNQVLLALVDEVEALKTKVVVVKQTSISTQNPRERKKIGSKTVYNFQEGSIYEIHAGVDRVTDIELAPGELLTNPPVAGDTVRWKISVLEAERSQQKRTHVVIKPTEENIETNLILTTNKNVYHLRLRASDWYMPAVSWNYPEDEARALEGAAMKRKQSEPLHTKPESLNFNYELSGRKYGWKPKQVFDDGEKTYIRMPENLSTAEAPALFVLDRDDTPMLVNYRVKGSYYIVDRLFPRAELRVGQSEKVEIISERDDRDFFERLF